ncbi:entericidin A/B family lipoprotein [Qipengyuania sp. 1NDW9]|uniref:Entericidin A/B family lipoprotein n=2 Tax=Qipengyuania TaxID=1855416 RepID=A0A9Q3S169_9SPHN|nr:MULTISPECIES: entericidin A/B family lipoprotein [Qipengyuania]MBX7492490.1 entericidin A/B family lipoprotein [Qipengyuania xiapuensis]MBY6128144.1 entericidin A/B family lipoprotein [Qipengyuania aquimaris]MBY6218339.1 entericidin A/B family lipoprotein [Qipengyuania aquimaris]QZD93300.1 entericidin A/B family lipoprotein [Qipengyuania xiapuensis]UOR15421.1 entericidin A/B family lipoprotein [Qipengyuania aquimaris]
MIKKLLIAFGITTMSLSAAACNTVQGLGEDIESVGEAGEDAID